MKITSFNPNFIMTCNPKSCVNKKALETILIKKCNKKDAEG